MNTTLEQWKQKVLANIREEDLIQLVLELCNIPSPYVYEKEAGDYVYDWMAKQGFKPKRVGLTSERFNVVGKLAGDGEGYSVLFSSHLDTGGPRGRVEDAWKFAPEKMDSPYWHTAKLENGVFFGQSVENDKGPMACFMIAAKAIKDAGVPLKGDIYLTACPGEMGQEPVSEYQGIEYVSKEVGAEYMMIHGGIMADYGIAAEGTDFGVSWVEAGKAFFKITVRGASAYTPLLQHAENLAEHRNPIVKSAVLIEAIHQWALEYEKKHTVHLPGGTVIPKVQIGAVRGGSPHYVIGGTDICEFYLDVRIPPGYVPGDVYRELKQVVSRTGLTADIELFLFRQGYEADHEKIQPLVQALGRSHSDVIGTELKMSDPGFSSMWRDHSVFNEYRVASLTYGPSRFTPSLEDLMNCAKVYALLALEIALKERE